MTYPLINGAAINEDDGGEVVTTGILAAQIGVPRAAFRFYSGALQAVTFGPAKAQIGVDVVAQAEGLKAVYAGPPHVVLGMPPSGTAFQAAGLDAMSTGRPSLTASYTTGQVGGVQVGSLGAPHLHFAARVGSGVAAAAFGQPGAGSAFSVTGIPAVQCGEPYAAFSFPVGAGTGPARAATAGIGMPRLVLGGMRFYADGLFAAQIGAPAFGGQKFGARGLLAARAGVPVLDRGAAC